jgi:serine/threonine-protein kinase
VVHRDVSPHNVFITYEGLVKLVDFGIAKAVDSSALTRAGVFKGKVAYSSPEQLTGEGTLDRRADVFALGVMLWEALAGQRIAHNMNERALMHRRLHKDDPPILTLAPDAPPELVRICEKAMAYDAADRYATAAELRADLEAFLDTSRRIGGEQLGALVREHFAADREKIRTIIEERIRTLDNPEALPEVSAVLDRVESTTKLASATASSAQPAPEKPRGRALLIVTAAAVTAAITITGYQLLRSAPAPSAAPPPSAAPAPATVDVSIRVDPVEARLFLDDAALTGNPFHGVMAKSPLARRLRAEAPGYASEERLVTLDRDVHLEMALKAAPQASASAAVTAPLPPRGRGPASPSTKGSASSTPSVTPGESLTNPNPKKSRSIDDNF